VAVDVGEHALAHEGADAVEHVAMHDAEDGIEKGDQQILRHYTDENGFNGITQSDELKTSRQALNPKDARHGDGAYLTDLKPGQGMTRGQVSRRLFGQPWAGHKLDYFIDIDVTGLGAQEVEQNIFLIASNEDFIDISGRIIRGGRAGW
jgi:hypothetical protein